MKLAPRVTVVIPMRNEERLLAKCLDSVLANEYPRDRLEILVIDGMSVDGSRRIAEDYARRHPCIRLLENPQQIQAAALNIGIREAGGDIVIRMDAHTTYAQDYIRECVTALQRTGAVNVGGALRAVGTDYLSNTIAIGVTSPFGTGDARFRYSEQEEWVDTVYLGAWYKRTLEDVGGFDEAWRVNEDYQLNYRLRLAGGKILLSPKIRCEYYVRGSLSGLVRQYFLDGFWKVKTLTAYPDSLRWRQFAPPCFVLAIAVSLVVLPFWWKVGLIVPGLYLAANFTASFQAAGRRGLNYLPFLPIVFAAIHLSWGVGFWAGIFRSGVPRFSLRSVDQAVRSLRGVRRLGREGKFSSRRTAMRVPLRLGEMIMVYVTHLSFESGPRALMRSVMLY